MSANLDEQARVLHVDDEPDFADLTETFLERESERLAVETATSAAEGLEMIRDRPPDCVVSDYNMPGMDGVELLETVREEYPDLPFILYTGRGSEEVASEAISAGATDYLQKGSGAEQYRLLSNRILNAVAQYRSEERLRETQEEYAAVFENAQNSLLLVAVEDDGFRYQQCNPQAVELIGRDRTEIVGHTPTEALGPENANKVLSAYRRCVEQREPVEYTVTLDLPVGRVTRKCKATPVTSGGECEQLVVEFHDITERKEREQELAYQKSLFEATVEASPSGIHVVDDSQEIVAHNDQFVEMWDIPEEVIAARSSEQAIMTVKDKLQRPEEFVEKVSYLYDHPEEESRDRIHLTDGRVFDRYSAPVTDETGTHYGRVWIFRDTTDVIERTRKLERQNERLEEFVGIVSHDLRSPLNVAEGRIELAREERDSEHLGDAAEALNRALALIDDLLTLARTGEQIGEVEAVALESAIEECWRTVETAEATLVAETDRAIRADPGRLKQLLANLTRNAVEHGGESVTVTVGDLADGFYVADDGPGISPDERERVLEAGYSTTEQGTGFGLHIVEEVAETHGWNLVVTESGEGGTRFEFTGVESANG